MKKTLKLLTAILALGLMFGACKKDEDTASKGSKGNKSVQSGGKGVYLASEFDKTATYTYNVTSGGAYDPANTVYNPITTLGNSSFYNIFSENVDTKVRYSSFCGNVGSTAFGGSVYTDKTEEFKNFKPGLYDKILKVLNYVYDNYDGLDVWVTDEGTHKNKTIAAIAIHAILDDMLENYMNGTGGWGTYDYANEAVNEAVKKVLANYQNYPYTNSVTEFVYLTGPKYPNDIVECQPQIIPLVGEVDACEAWMESEEFLNIVELFDPLYEFMDGTQVTNLRFDYIVANYPEYADCFMPLSGIYDCDDYLKWLATLNSRFNANNLVHVFVRNWLEEQIESLGCNTPVLGPAYGSVTATREGNVPTILGTLNPKNGNAQFPASYNAFGIVYNSNHFCFAKFTRAELEAGVTLDMVVGNKIDIVGKATAQIVGGNIVVEIENFGKGNFGVMAFNKPMTDKFPKNGNIHSQKEADLKKELGATTGFDHNNNLVVPCPDGNCIYLYIHCGTIQFWQ
jgi:hypothetical protein